MSPPLRKLRRTRRVASLSSPSSSSSSSSSGVGEAGLEEGADRAHGGPAIFLGRGNAVPQISHAGKEGWFKNVQAEHAISPFAPTAESPVGFVEDPEEERRLVADEGKDVDRKCDVDCCIVFVGIGDGEPELFWEVLLGTPQSPHTLDAAGLKPGGFL